MCRIIVASGNIEVTKILESITLMAQDKNTIHELNKQDCGNWQHTDGWGITYIDQKGNFIIKKSPQAVFEDPELLELRQLTTNFMIAHVRKKVGSETSLENTHPFRTQHPLLGECIFCHNGFIKENINFDSTTYTTRGETDSERLFYSILSEIAENNHRNIVSTIRKNLQRYTKTRGSNIVLATKEKTYVAMRKNELPQYFGMMLGQGKDFMIISSEKLKTYPDISWISILPEEVVTIQNGTTSFSISKENKSFLQKIIKIIQE